MNTEELQQVATDLGLGKFTDIEMTYINADLAAQDRNNIGNEAVQIAHDEATVKLMESTETGRAKAIMTYVHSLPV